MKDMSLLLENFLHTWLVRALNVNTKGVFDHLMSNSQSLFTITGNNEDAVDVSVAWGELMIPIMLVIKAVMLRLVIPRQRISHVLPHSVVEDIIFERLSSKLA